MEIYFSIIEKQAGFSNCFAKVSNQCFLMQITGLLNVKAKLDRKKLRNNWGGSLKKKRQGEGDGGAHNDFGIEGDLRVKRCGLDSKTPSKREKREWGR